MVHEVALRVTGPRVAVLSAVHDGPHTDPAPIIGVLREDLGDMSHRAVDDVLRAPTAAGQVWRLRPMGPVARYLAWVGDNHHQIVGRSCGAIADVGRAVGDTARLTAADHSGYEIDSAEVSYRGRGQECVPAACAGSGG
jgi:Fur family ferric uptake transcriptional regulator